MSNFIQPVYGLSRTPVSDETPFAGLSPAISASQACRQLSQPYRLFASGLLLRLLGRNLSLVASDLHLDASLSRDLEDAKLSSSVLRGESRPPSSQPGVSSPLKRFAAAPPVQPGPSHPEDDPAYAGPSRQRSTAAMPVQPGPSHPEDDPASAGPSRGWSCDSLRRCYHVQPGPSHPEDDPAYAGPSRRRSYDSHSGSFRHSSRQGNDTPPLSQEA